MVTTEANCRRFTAPYLKSKYFPILWRFKDIQICKYNVRVRHGGDDDDIEPLCEMVHDTCENKKWNKREFCETIKQRNYFQRLVQCAQTNAYLWWRRRRRLTSSNEREPFCRCTSYHRHTHTHSLSEEVADYLRQSRMMCEPKAIGPLSPSLPRNIFLTLQGSWIRLCAVCIVTILLYTDVLSCCWCIALVYLFNSTISFQFQLHAGWTCAVEHENFNS